MTHAGRWDSHAHVIDDPARYPLSPTRAYEPPSAPLAAYLALLDELGLTNGVLVQPSVYGFDNRCLLDALDAGEGRLYGIAVPAPDSSTTDLETMNARGVRGVRCNLLDPHGLTVEQALRWQPVMRDLGWHVELHIAVERAGDLRAVVEPFEVPVVVDHMGRPAPGSADPSMPHLEALAALVREGVCLVKLSAPYRLSAMPAPWDDVVPLARALLAANAGACMWATDWPHTDTRAPIAVADLVRALVRWCPDDAVREGLTARARNLFRPGQA